MKFKKQEYNKPLRHEPYCQYTLDLPPKIKYWRCCCDIIREYDKWKKSPKPICKER